ncbi:MAG: oligosaccharide flippase family protein [Nitrososphaerales archaeon]
MERETNPSPDVASQHIEEATTGRSRNIARGLTSLALQNLIGSILAVIFLAAVTKLVSPTAYGAYSAIQVIATGIGIGIGMMGLQYAGARYVAFWSAKDNTKLWSSAKAILILGFAFSITTSLVVVGLCSYLSLYFMKNTAWADVFALGALWLFANSMSFIMQGIIQGMKKYMLLAKILLISRIVMVVMTVLGLELYHNVDIAILAWVVYSAITLLWCFRIIQPNISRVSANGQYSPILHYSIPIGIASLLGTIASYADIVVVGGYLNPTLLGIYNLDIQISAFLNMVIVLPLSTALLPEFSSSSNNPEISNGLRLAFRFLVLGLLPCSFLLAALSPQLLSLISTGGIFFLGTIPLEIIALTFILVGIQFVAMSLLQAIGKTLQVLILGIFTVGVDIGTSVLLVPWLGMDGAALARVAVGLVGTVIGLYFVRNHLHGLDHYLFYIKALIASLVPFAVVSLLSFAISSRALSLVPYLLIGGGLFLACLKMMNILTDEDRSFLAHLLPNYFQKILRYI